MNMQRERSGREPVARSTGRVARRTKISASAANLTWMIAGVIHSAHQPPMTGDYSETIGQILNRPLNPRERLIREASPARNASDHAKGTDRVREGERPAALSDGIGRDGPQRRREPKKDCFV